MDLLDKPTSSKMGFYRHIRIRGGEKKKKKKKFIKT